MAVFRFMWVRFMQFTNSTDADILIFVYTPGDLFYLDCINHPSRHLILANAEALVPRRGGTVRLRHRTERSWMLGIKAAGMGRFGPFLVPLSPQTYTARDVLELDASGALIWHTAPKPVTPPTPSVPPAVLNQPLPAGPARMIGVGRANITDLSARDAASGLPMQGWAEAEQRSTMIDNTGADLDAKADELPLIARAFIIADPATQSRAVLVVADLWSGSIALHQEVVRRLDLGNGESRYHGDNIMIAGTHTHSAMGGYLQHTLYNFPFGLAEPGIGFDPHVFESVVAGIVCAIENAHMSLAPGRVSVVASNLSGLTRNRSFPAFLANPAAERAQFANAVDERVIQLNFEREMTPGRGDYEAVGLLNWFAIHPTNFGKKWTRLGGDNKGWAAHLVESRHGKGFVAGFANACAGDVSGNFIRGATGFDPVQGTNYDEQRKRMQQTGAVQAEMAEKLLGANGSELTGPVRSASLRVDMVRRTGAPGALGLSMMAGSSEDGGPGILPEGIRMVDPADPFSTSFGDLLGTLAQPVTLAVNGLLIGLSVALSGNLLSALLASVSLPPFADPALTVMHFPKPLMLIPGLFQPVPWVPDMIPLQVIRCGQFATVGIPAEVTTVAGLRIRNAAASILNKDGVEHIPLTTYANGYASYVTTPEEYAEQHYEGASTLYGPQTQPVIADAVRTMVAAMIARQPQPHDGPLRDMRDSVITRRRMTFRNETKDIQRFRLYFPHDRSYHLLIWPGADFRVDPGLERAIFTPFPSSLVVGMVQVIGGEQRLRPGTRPTLVTYAMVHDLVVMTDTGQLIRTDYYPANRNL